MIIEGLRANAEPIDQFIPDPKNKRRRTPKNRDMIRKSLLKYGQRRPLVVRREDNVVESGNGMLEMARELGWKEIAVVWADDDEATAAAYAIVDNRSGELSEWDSDALADAYTDEDLDLDFEELGFDDLDLEELGIDTGAVTVDRHRTAVGRKAWSAAAAWLDRLAYLDGSRTVLDYGCGRGDDVRAMKGQGVDAVGWDPHWQPDSPKRASDIVVVSCVINCIEVAAERAALVAEVAGLAGQLVCVSVINGRPAAGSRAYRDGHLTSADTFQKYFTQAELARLLEPAGDVELLDASTALVFLTDEAREDFGTRKVANVRKDMWSLRFECDSAERYTEALEALRGLGFDV